jgi:serine/threonine protein kinase
MLSAGPRVEEPEMVGDCEEFPTIEWEELQNMRRLSAGSVGTVLQAQWNGFDVAVKVVDNPSQRNVDELRKAALRMAAVGRHPHIVEFIGASYPSEGMAIVYGLCSGGTLLQALERRQLDLLSKTRVLGEVAMALAFLHAKNIVHGDVAARNVLLDGSGRAKLADLGLDASPRFGCAHVDVEPVSLEATTSSVRWMAPETIRERRFSPASDAYAYGALLVEVWSDGTPPFAHIRALSDVAMAVLLHGERPAVPDQTPPSHASLAHRLFDSDPDMRPTLRDICAIFGRSSRTFDEEEFELRSSPRIDPSSSSSDSGEFSKKKKKKRKEKNVKEIE